MCEIRSKDKITAGELLSVQCLRLLEQNKINDKHQAIELSASELEYDTNGHLVRPERFLARRAELLLPNYHLRAEIFSKMFWGFILSGIVLILFLGLCVIPFAKSDNILGGTTTNLAGPFFFFIVLQLFFLFLSVSLLLLSGIFYIFIRLFKGKKTADKFSGKMNWFSATLGTVLLYLIRGLDHCRRKLSCQKQSEEPCAIPQFTAKFTDYLLGRKKPIFCLSGFYSHLFWFVVSLSLLFCLLMNMQKTIYHYRWESSITSIEEVRLMLDKISFLYPPSLRPNDEEIQSLFNVPVNISAKKGLTESVTRRSWSLFVLWTVFIACVLPRGILATVFLMRFKQSLNSYAPDLNDPYFRKIIQQAEESIGQIRTEEAAAEGTAPDNDAGGTIPLPLSFDYLDGGKISNQSVGKKDLPKQFDANNILSVPDPRNQNKTEAQGSNPVDLNLKDAGPNKSIQSNTKAIDSYQKALNEFESKEKLSSAASNSTDQRSVADSLSVFKAEVVSGGHQTATGFGSNGEMTDSQTVVFGYDTAMNETDWQKIFSNSRLTVFGNIAADRSLKKEFRQRLTDLAPSVSRLVLLLDSSATPVRQQLLFFGEIFQTAGKSNIYVLLSCGDRLNRLFGRNAEKIGQRLDDWRDSLRLAAEKFGLFVEIITFFDHEKATAESFRRLRLFFEGKTVQNISNDNKINQAFQLIQKETDQIFDQENFIVDQERDLAQLTDLYQNIEKIYQEESGGFIKRCGDLLKNSRLTDIPLDKIKECLPESVDLEEIKNKLIPSAAMMGQVRRLCSRLSGKGAVAFGALGAALPLAAVAAPLFSAPLTLASLAALAGGIGSLLPTSLAAGGIGAALGSVTPLSLATLRDKIKDEFSFFELKTQEEDSPLSKNKDKERKIRQIAALTETGLLWTIVFELQGEPEEKIAENLPLIMKPVETADFSSPENIKKTLDEIRTKRFEIFDRINNG